MDLANVMVNRDYFKIALIRQTPGWSQKNLNKIIKPRNYCETIRGKAKKKFLLQFKTAFETVEIYLDTVKEPSSFIFYLPQHPHFPPPTYTFVLHNPFIS